jgi:hypothetical protein
MICKSYREAGVNWAIYERQPGWTEHYTRGNRGELSTIREATVVLLLMKWTPSDMEMALDSRIPEWIKKVELWCSWKSLHCSSSCNSRIALVKNTMARLEGEREDWIVTQTDICTWSLTLLACKGHFNQTKSGGLNSFYWPKPPRHCESHVSIFHIWTKCRSPHIAGWTRWYIIYLLFVTQKFLCV